MVYGALTFQIIFLHLHPFSTPEVPLDHRPDITVMVDWALIINYLSIH